MTLIDTLNSKAKQKEQFSQLRYWFLLLFMVALSVQAQELKQSIQGVVIDNFTGAPLPGVNIIIIKDSTKLGGYTDEKGHFIIRNLPIGKYTLKASSIGYANYQTYIDLSSGKAVNLEIMLTVGTSELGGVSIKAYENKTQPINTMALIGARSFTPEEANRYAGSYGDPARMAMNYAGVLPVRDNRNDLIIRGNSAFGLQWRIDGIDIPNPNHFSASATTGGPITIINTNLIGRSDFFNGAFPAEYGNANAGVFDLHIKTPNIEKREMWFELGWNGLEFGSEGPIIKGKNASYIFSYRHSIANIFYDVAGTKGKKVDYQDLSFKFNFPKTKLGSWSIFGMGGKSHISLNEMEYSNKDRIFATYGEILDNSTSTGVLGITNQLFPNKRTHITTALSVTGNTVLNIVDTFAIPQRDPFLWATENTNEIKYSLSSIFHYRINDNSQLVGGGVYDHYVMSFHDLKYLFGDYVYFTDTSNAQADLLQLHIGYKHLFGNRLEAYIGLHGQYFFMNNSKAIEPRFSLKYIINKKSSISYGLGWHSQLQPKMMYYVQSRKQDGDFVLTNNQLDFTRSIHNALAYNYMFNKNLRLKVDVYYQHLYDVPIQSTQPAYSTINFGTEYYVERKDSLINVGTGKNYGIEITFERFLKRHFFYLFTATLFESKFTSSDHITRNTAYNGQYAFNAVGGYELVFPKKHVSMLFGLNLTYAGGSPYVPFDVAETLKYGRAMYDWDHAYEVRREDYKRISVRIGVKRNYKRFSTETAFDFQYRGDYTSIYQERINVTTGEIVDTRDMGFYPMANLRINF